MTNLLKLGKDIAKRNPDFAQVGNEISSQFGNMVFYYRLQKGFTQVQLAEQAGVAPSTIHRIEGGSGGITGNTYGKVFKVLEINSHDIANFFLERETSKQRELELQI